MRTWLYSGIHDTVVPIRNATILAHAMKLDKTRHIRMQSNHYSGIVYMPLVLGHISDRIEGLQESHAVRD